MALRPSFRANGAIKRRQERRTKRILANRTVAEALISVAGLVGRAVSTLGDIEVGRISDVVVRWSGEGYPPVTGLVVRVGRRRAYVPIEQVQSISQDGARLKSARLDLRDFNRRDDEVSLSSDVVDHQLVDIDGVRVVRASDLYLALVGEEIRLVGVDVGFATLLRRLGPANRRTRPTPDRVIDWAAVQPFGTGDGPMRLASPNQALKRLRPAELADLLEELGRDERQELLRALDPEAAADALEEMEPGELRELLREMTPEDAAALLIEMEPDEAVDALREFEDEEVDALIAVMPRANAALLAQLLGYDEESAGGVMTTNLILVRPDMTVGEVRRVLRSEAEHQADVDAVIIVDADGRLIHDIGLFELLVAAKEDSVGSLDGGPEPVTVSPETSVALVVEQFIESRGSSVVVVDAENRPIGRILADDLVDALVPERGKLRFPRFLVG